MKILIDTNVLLAASKYPNGTPFKALLKASEPPNYSVVSEQNLEELKNVYSLKFPNDMYLFENFLALIIPKVEIIPIPVDKATDENKIPHAKDRPILRAAVAANVDVIITGDKDFLEAGLTKPKIMSPAEFVKLQ